MDPRERAQDGRSEPGERREPAKRRASEPVGESEGRSPSDKVDELRRQLRSLGYLEAGVDRFVLGPAQERRAPAALAARLAVRVGLIGGLLLGPAAAIGVGARLPGLVSGVRDAAVIAVYLALVFFVAVAALSFTVSLSLLAVARTRGERFTRLAALASRAAGWIIAAAGLVYLTMWWRNTNAGFGWSAPLWTSFALLVAVAISLLLGHAQRIATLAVLASAAGASAQLPREAARSWRVILAGAGLAFAGAAMLLVVTTSADQAPAAAFPLPVVSHGVTVKVLAVDGVDPTLVDERTWAPAWATGYRYALEYGNTEDPARSWTTIATGQPPEVHGIHAIEGRRIAGISGMLSRESSATARILPQATDLIRLTRPTLTSRNERKVMTFWEVAEAAGLRSTVINWWATWPAATRNGIVVSDRAVLRLERGGTLDAEISPPSAYEDLQKQWPRISGEAQALAQRTFASVPDRDVAAILIRSATLDASVLAMDGALAQADQDLDVVYLPGLDIAQYALLGNPGAADAAPSALAARLGAVRAYHEFLRELIRPWFRPVNKQVTCIITAPGRVGSRAAGHITMFQWIQPPPDIGRPTRDVRVEEAPPRLAEIRDRRAHAVDIGPTILNLLGLPISRDLPGTALDGFVPRVERYVPTYGAPSSMQPARSGKPLDQEMIDRLRSLGYVK